MSEQNKSITTKIAEGAGKAVESVKDAFSGASKETEKAVTDVKHGAQDTKLSAEQAAEKTAQEAKQQKEKAEIEAKYA